MCIKFARKLFFYYVTVIYATTGRTEQTLACVSRYDRSAWTANYSNDKARNDTHIVSTGVRVY